MLDTVGEGQVRRDRLPIGEELLLKMVEMANRQWDPEKAILMTAIFLILYHGCIKEEPSRNRQGREIRA